MKDIIEMATAVGYPLMVFDGVPYVSPALERFAALVRADEREACAKVCETYNKRQCYNDEDMAVANECAAAIRARGQA